MDHEQVNDSHTSADEDDSEDSIFESDTESGDLERVEETLEIKVKQVGKGEDDVLHLKVNPKSSVLDLKTQISKLLAAKNTGVPVDRQRLMFFGRMLRDDHQILGSEGVKMQTEAINYVHLSPLPEGVNPSPRSNPMANFCTRQTGSTSSRNVALEAVERSIEQSLERARRMGAAARERRRRRRAQPYDTARRCSNRIGTVVEAAESEQPPSAATAGPASSLAAFASMASSEGGGGGGQGNASHFNAFQASALGRALLAAGPSFLPGVSPFSDPSQFPGLQQGLAMAAASAESTLANRVNAQLSGQIHQGSSDLIPFLSLVQERLRRIATSNNLGNCEADLLEVANALDHMSSEARSLSFSLRRASEAMPPAPVPSASVNNSLRQLAPIPLDPVLNDGENDPSYFLSSPSLLLPSGWFPPMM